MSDTDLRAAAERCRSINPIGGTWSYGAISDAKLLVAAYLAEHRPDDGEAVDESWLYSIGFVDDRAGCPTLGALHIQPQAIVVLRGEYPAYACIRSLAIPIPATRGDVRTLLRLLGVEAKEAQ